jgi:hypothetical protein
MARSQRLLALIATLAAMPVIAACGSGDSSVVRGSAYEYKLPGGWEEASDQASREAEQRGWDAGAVDSAAGQAGVISDSSLLVIAPPGPTPNSVKELARGSATLVANAHLRQIRNVVEAGASPGLVHGYSRPSRPKPTQLGGEPAMRFHYTASFSLVPTDVTQVATIHDGTAYLLASGAPATAGDRAEAALEEILHSWVWR